MFEQTAEALTSAIDAKDSYTHAIPPESRKSPRGSRARPDCRTSVRSGVLRGAPARRREDRDPGRHHQQGRRADRRGIRADQAHTTLGDQILSSINSLRRCASGALSSRALRRTGYPTGSPARTSEVARIIAVADAYDAHDLRTELPRRAPGTDGERRAERRHGQTVRSALCRDPAADPRPRRRMTADKIITRKLLCFRGFTISSAVSCGAAGSARRRGARPSPGASAGRRCGPDRPGRRRRRARPPWSAATRRRRSGSPAASPPRDPER